MEFKDLKLETLDTYKISKVIDEWEHKITAVDSHISIVESSLSETRKKLVDARANVNNLRKIELDSETTLKKGYQVRRTLEAEKRMIEREYWRKK